MNPPPVRPCMGGWCPHRDKCDHYTVPTWREAAAERLCEKGAEHVMFFQRQS